MVEASLAARVAEVEAVAVRAVVEADAVRVAEAELLEAVTDSVLCGTAQFLVAIGIGLLLLPRDCPPANSQFR